MDEVSLASQIEILVDGAPVSAEIMSLVEEVVVDQHTHLPGLFTLRFSDPEMSLTDGSTFSLTSEVEVKGYSASGGTVSLIMGEITAIEPLMEGGMTSSIVVQGLHKSHRMFRQVKSKSYLNIKDSDIATQIAGSVGLSPQVESTTTVYDHLFQHNQTDLAFLNQRAWRIGYECFVDDNKLYFRKPLESGATITLKWGEALISFRARESLAEQVSEVLVKGWDPASMQAIVGSASSGTLYPASTAGGEHTKARDFGAGSVSLVDVPVVSQAEANNIAQARLDELSGAFVVAEGVAYQQPGVRAGQFVKLEGIGTKFSGTYMVSQARHVFNEDGLTVHFTARGARSGLLADQLSSPEPVDRWPGMVVGVVTNTDDPNKWGRVKVKFPWLSDSDESWWARLVMPGAGPQAGFCAIPEINDEVAVIFEHGDFDRPVVIGGMWNGQHAIPQPVDGAPDGERPLIRTWYSRTGHQISVYDNTDNKVEVRTVSGHWLLMDDQNKKVDTTTSGGHKVTMDDQGKKVELTTAGGHKITLDDNSRKITIQATGDVEVKSGTNMTLQAGAAMEIKASGPINIKGAVVNIN